MIPPLALTAWRLEALPPLPAGIVLAGGPVVIQRVSPKALSEVAGDALGYATEAPRRILLRDDLDPLTMWRVFGHELTHLALFDSGVSRAMRSVDPDRHWHEAVCDAMGLALVAAMTHQAGSFQAMLGPGAVEIA